MEEKKILIVGAGFGGVRCALDLAEHHLKNVKITLVNPSPHFEYHASLYRVLTGRSPLEVCVPLREIFSNKKIELTQDMITDVNFKENKALGRSSSTYFYDYLVLGLGSETAYYDISGLKDWSFSMKSIAEVLDLKKHLHELFSKTKKDQDESLFHIVIVGGGATGVETAGELAVYTKRLAETHSIDPTLITIDLITSSKRLVPQLPTEMSEKIRLRLGSLGVNVYVNRRIKKEEVEEIYMKDMQMRAKTVIWTAGIKGNELYNKIGLPVNSTGQVIVNKYLQPFNNKINKQFNNVFIIGDGADREFSGFAQTAIQHGRITAENILKSTQKQPAGLNMACVEEPMYAIPVGSKWAAAEFFGGTVYGRLGWFFRRLDDLRFFLSILPFSKALTAWKEDGILWESCPVCKQEIF